MSVKQRVQQISHHWVWYALSFLWATALCMLMFRGGNELYWGPVDSDLTNQFYPWRVFLHRWIERGVFAFWDPHVFSGYPTIETQQMLNLNPLHLLTIWLDPEVGLTAFTGLNTLIGCLGMMWALRRCGRCSPMAAALGGGLYVFGGLFAVRVMAGHITVVSALAWWPLAAITVLRIVRLVPAAGSDRRTTPSLSEFAGLNRAWKAAWTSHSFRRLIAVSALAHAMVCLAGAPQYIVYLFYIDLAVLAASARRWNLSGPLSLLAAIWVLALVLSAPQWLPALWYLPYSGRALSEGGLTGLSLAPMVNIWLEMLMPFPFGDDLGYGHLHFKNVWETATYPGGFVIILSLAAAFRCLGWLGLRLGRRAALYAPGSPIMLAGLLILLAGFYMMVGGWLPGFSGFREPLKARALVAFGFAITSAAAFDAFVLRSKRWSKSVWAAILLTAAMLITATSYTHPEQFQSLIRSFGTPMDALAGDDYLQAMSDPTDAIKRFWLAILGGSVGLFAALLCFPLLRKNQQLLAMLLFLFALGDPYLHHARVWVARHPWSKADLPDPIKDYFTDKLRNTNDRLPWRAALHSGIINRTHHIDGLFEIYGYDPLMPAYGVSRMLLKGSTQLPLEVDRSAMRLELLHAVGVRYDAREWWPHTAKDATTTPAVIEIPGAALFELTRNVVPQSPGINLFGPDLNGRHYVLPAEVGGRISSDPDVPQKFRQEITTIFGKPTHEDSATSGLAAGEQLLPLESGRPDVYGVQTSLTSPALLVYKGTWLPGWSVLIDDRNVGPALFANNWMPAAIVPAGDHDVVFKYRPVAWIPSLVISCFGLLTILALAVPRSGRSTGKLQSRGSIIHG